MSAPARVHRSATAPARRVDRFAMLRRFGAAIGRTSNRASAHLQRLGRIPGLGWIANARMLVTIGLVSMVISAHLVVGWIGVVEDPSRAKATARAALAEAVAAGSMNSLSHDEFDAVRDLLQFTLERNETMSSAAIRREDGSLIASVGPHEVTWTRTDGERSTVTQIAVPMYAAGARWGRLEMAWNPAPGGAIGAYVDGRASAIALIALICFGGFYLYLGRMLQQLDPSRAVPDRVRNALDTLAEGLMLVDAQGRIVIANAALCELLGRTTDDLVGKPAASLDWSADGGGAIDPAVLPWVRALGANRPLKHQAIGLSDARGERRSFLANCAPVGSDAGAPAAGVLVSLDDITELQRKEVLLREATERAEQASRSKSDFLANMSHEIRTPMNAILGFTEMLRRGRAKDAATARRHLDTVHANGAHLLALINDILDLSKVEAGQFQIERIPCAPHKVIADVVEVLSVKAVEKSVVLRREVTGPVPAEVLGDPSRLRQVITNLVGNAIKFTERGEVVVTLTWVPPREGRAPQLRIDVRDSGIGIAADKVGAIFEPFVQADSSTARKFGGTGLGLSISRKFARAMGGDITVASEPGRGSTFSVTIDPGPLAQLKLIEPDEALQESVHDSALVDRVWRFPPRRLLVVDDSPENRELVALTLQDTGLIVEQADSGTSALAAVAAKLPDMILMDMQMPGMDGYTATRHLRTRGVRIPIYAFTAHALSGFDKEISAAGCDGYLTKPIDIEAMLETLAERLGGERVEAPLATGTDAGTLLTSVVPDVPSAATSAAAGDTASVTSRLAGNQRFTGLVTSFAQRLPERIAALRAAHDAGDAGAFADIAHWLKGSAGSLGYDAFTAPAREAENAARTGDLATAREPLERIESLAHRVVAPASVEAA